MKKVILASASFILLASFTTQPFHFDPTGTYKLDSKTRKKDGEIYGYFGEIRVKKVGNDKVIMAFEVSKGAPSYNSGSFFDTLSYIDNKATYTDPESDPTCKITFEFDKKGIIVKEETANYNTGCGFGHAVVADGFYKKTSNKTPAFTGF